MVTSRQKFAEKHSLDYKSSNDTGLETCPRAETNKLTVLPKNR